ncbi:MAG: NAD(P)-dependent alcohol dehydrogenase [Acidobacteriota bacterium]
MRALVYDRFGGADELQLRELPVPVAGDGERVVKVIAAALNPIDWKIMQGDLQFLSGRRFPRRLGADFAGTVTAVGPGQSAFRVGDAVFGAVDMLKGDRGSVAEFALVHADECVTKPAAASFVQAAGLGVAGGSALICVDGLGKARAGQRLLMVGAAGGLGSGAMQIAKQRGLHVTAVCSQRNIEFVREYGADTVVAYDVEDVFARHEQFDLIIDAVLAHPYARWAALLTSSGIYIATVPRLQTFLAGLRARLISRKRVRALVGRVNAGHFRELARLVESGQFRAAVCHTFALADARQAVALSMTRRARGKIVITVAAEGLSHQSAIPPG